MSGDDGYIVQQNSKGKWVAQHHFWSSDGMPDPDKVPESSQYKSLEDVISAYKDAANESEYGFDIVYSSGPPTNIAPVADDHTLHIPFPRVAPLYWEVDKKELVQEVWDAFVKPEQDASILQSAEMRILMAILRSFYKALEDREKELESKQGSSEITPGDKSVPSGKMEFD